MIEHRSDTDQQAAFQIAAKLLSRKWNLDITTIQKALETLHKEPAMAYKAAVVLGKLEFRKLIQGGEVPVEDKNIP